MRTTTYLLAATLMVGPAFVVPAAAQSKGPAATIGSGTTAGYAATRQPRRGYTQYRDGGLITGSTRPAFDAGPAIAPASPGGYSVPRGGGGLMGGPMGGP